MKVALFVDDMKVDSHFCSRILQDMWIELVKVALLAVTSIIRKFGVQLCARSYQNTTEA